MTRGGERGGIRIGRTVWRIVGFAAGLGGLLGLNRLLEWLFR